MGCGGQKHQTTSCTSRGKGEEGWRGAASSKAGTRERTTTHSNGKQKAHKKRREKKKKKREATTAAVWEFGVWRRASNAANGLFLIAGEEVNKAPVVNLVVADVALVKHPTQQ